MPEGLHPGTRALAWSLIQSPGALPPNSTRIRASRESIRRHPLPKTSLTRRLKTSRLELSGLRSADAESHLTAPFMTISDEDPDVSSPGGVIALIHEPLHEGQETPRPTPSGGGSTLLGALRLPNTAVQR